MTEAMAGWLRGLMDLIAMAQTSAVDALVATQDARQRQTLYQEQQQQVRELSSPVIKVWEEVLVLPLVGTIDSDRAAQVMEDLLQGIVAHQAEVVIVDVTGVPVVDTYAVNYLMQTIKAAGLLGARSVLVGISAEVAQAMISLGVDLKGIETRGNLQAGIEFALQALHLQVVPTDGASFA
jgi:rsbT co-antagonist protein RsbR